MTNWFNSPALIIISAALSIMLLWPQPQGVLSQPVQQCDLIAVGQIPERVLEIHQELVALFTIAGAQDYTRMLALAPQLAELLAQCSAEVCTLSASMCPLTCDPYSCNIVSSCGPPAPGQEVCPPAVRNKINALFVKIQDAYDEIAASVQKAGLLWAELTLLEIGLDQAKARLQGLNPATHELFNCNETKSIGRQRACTSKELQLLGSPPPLIPLVHPNSQFDYFECAKP